MSAAAFRSSVPEAIGGRHRQAGTGRLIRYWAPLAVFECGDRVFYAASLSDEVGGCGLLQRAVAFDPKRVAADEAARAALCRDIDATELPPGQAPVVRSVPPGGSMRWLW